MPENEPNRVALALNVEPGEGGRLALLWTQSFVMGIALVSFYAASSALFLSAYGSDRLPHMYITAAVVSTLFGLAYARFLKRNSPAAILVGTSVAMLIMIVGLRVSLDTADGIWPRLLLRACYPLLQAMLAVLLWDLAGRLFDVRQGKRLFGLIGAGEQLATVLGGVSTPILVALLGTPNLLFLSVLALGINLVMTVAIVRRYGERFGIETATPQDDSGQERMRDLLHSRYVTSIFLLSLLMMTVYHLVDFMFYDQARSRYSDQNALTNFFGLYQGISQAATFLVITVVTGRFISRFGIKIGMRVRPFTMLVCGIALTAVWAQDSGLTVYFIVATVTKFLDHVILRSFSGPSSLVLYQPLPARRKLAVQLFNNTTVGPIAGGLVGCLLLLLAHLQVLELGVLSSLMVVVIGAWIVVGKKVYGEYQGSLSEALVRRVLDGGSSIYDDSMIEILKRRLESPHPGEVIYALDLLDKVENESSADHYAELLMHPHSEVRKEVLHRIGREQLGHLMDDVRDVVFDDVDDEVIAAALRALCALGESDVLDEVLPYIEHPDPIVRRGVISGMLRYGGIDGVLLAGQHLVELENSEDPADRVFTAQVLGDVGITSFYRPLIRLMRDGDVDVRMAAVAAAGDVRNPRLWPLVIQHLETTRFHPYAATALVRAGDRAIAPIRDVLASDDFGREVKTRSASVCGRIGGEAAQALLVEHLSYSDRTVRTSVLTALHHCGYRAGGPGVVDVRRLLRQEVADLAWRLAVHADIEQIESCQLLVRAIEYEVDETRRRIFQFLSFLYDSRTILRAEENLRRSSQQRAYALEVLETTVSRDLRRLLFPILEWERLQDQRVALGDAFPQETVSPEDRLSEILSEEERWISPWMKACTLFALKDVSGAASGAVAQAFFNHPDRLVKETALWGAGETDHLEETRGGRPMLLTIERVLALKSVDLFSGVPEEVLAALAAVMEEHEFEANQPVYEKGETGRSMYIIVEGRVKVHDGDRTFVELEERDFFGELTTLDPAPHSATVTATEDVRLLGLDREPLYELMADHPEVLRKIIHELCERLRGKR